MKAALLVSIIPREVIGFISDWLREVTARQRETNMDPRLVYFLVRLRILSQ
jgi:hypothetical protein